ncbi:class II aldolase/adducin family protein [Pelagibacterales bacterium SAG-MED13]|nr:class II aldolase/adducin family protein [Pelagibacterales bacterium SAG-MED13]
MKNLDQRNKIIEYSLKLNSTNLSPLRSGNISLRGKENDKEGYLITPSGKKYETLKPEDIIFMGLNEDAENIDLTIKPSSEWRFHRDIYINKKEAQAIVHAHSPHATAVSSHGKPIPPFHYMIALAGGDDIKCAEYATFGTEELSRNVIKALKNRSACLMSNHGQVAFGKNLEDTFELAQEVENICHQYTIALRLGQPKILSFEEMKKVLDKAKSYKKG